MAEYRDMATPGPLIWSAKSDLFALDPATGELKWKTSLPGHIQRLVRLANRLYVLDVHGLTCFDIETGQRYGAIPLEFVPSAVIATGDRLFLAGPEGAAAVSVDGSVIWSAKQEFAKGFTISQNVICTGGDGQELWTEKVSGSSRYDNPGMLFADQVAQPDIDSQ